MSRFISVTGAVVRRLSAPAFLLHSQFTRQPPILPPPPQHFPSFSPFRKHLHSSAAVMRISSATNPPAVQISVTSFFCCQFVLFSNLSRSFASGAKRIEDIVVILLQIKRLLQTCFSQQCMQLLILMCGTAVSMIFPVAKAIIIAVEEAFADTPMIFCVMLAGGVIAAGLFVKFLWDKLFRPWIMHKLLSVTCHC